MAKATSIRYPLNIREEELKNKVAADWFKDFDTTQITVLSNQLYGI